MRSRGAGWPCWRGLYWHCALGVRSMNAGAQAGAGPEATSFPVSIRVLPNRARGEMRPVWRYFGYDEPNYTYMKDGGKLLSQLRR